MVALLFSTFSITNIFTVMAVWHSKYWFWGTQYLYLKYFVHGHPLEPWRVKCESTAQPVLCLLFRDGGISALLQLLLCYNQIMIIVSLCLDEGRSLISKLFNSNLMQLLGRISMSLYLIHDPLIFYLQFLFNGKTFDISIWIYNMLSKHSCLLIQEFSQEFGIGKMMLKDQNLQFGLCPFTQWFPWYLPLCCPSISKSHVEKSWKNGS